MWRTGTLLHLALCARPAGGNNVPVASYVTLWKDQIAPWGLDPEANPGALNAWLGEVRAAGVSHVMISVSWTDVEPDEGRFTLTPVRKLVGKIVQANLQVMMVLDAYRAPSWLYKRYPDARPLGGGPPGHPCNGRIGGFHAFAHTEAFALALRFVSRVVEDVVNGMGPSAVQSFQPNFNNELEARYAQECDIFLDYSNTTIKAYREWLRDQNNDASYWLRRWGLQLSPKGGLLWSKDTQRWQWHTITPPNVYGDTLQAIGDPKPVTEPRVPSAAGANRQLHKLDQHDHHPVTSLAYWDWQRFREVNLMRAYRTACDRVVAFGGHGCFLHFGEFFSSVDAINAVIFFQLANVSSITDLIVDTNFINFQKTQVDPVAASVLVSSAQLYEERSGNNAAKKRIWFEGAVERLGSGGGNLGGNVQILRDGFRHAVEAGATGLGVTNLKNLSYLTEIFPSPPKELVVQPWRPRALLFFPYETFYSYRRWSDSRGHDVLQKQVHDTYANLALNCQCQVQIVADAALLPAVGANARFTTRVWLKLPGVMPSAARNAIRSAMVAAEWREVGSSSHSVTLPVMGRETVQALPDFVIAGTPKGGTSSLANWLSASPWTCPSFQKEINFFDRHYDEGLKWYARFFHPHYGRAFNADVHIFEATPGYIYHPLAPQRMAALLPTARVLFLLRDPVQRARSDHAMWMRQGITRRPLEEMVRECVAVIDSRPRALAEGRVFSHVLDSSCAPRAGAKPSDNAGNLCKCWENIVAKGLYAEQLARWASVYPRSQLLAIDTEELMQPAQLMQRLGDYLGLPMKGVDTSKLEAVNTAENPINLVIPGQERQPSSMGANVTAMLADFFARAPDYKAQWLKS